MLILGKNNQGEKKKKELCVRTQSSKAPVFFFSFRFLSLCVCFSLSFSLIPELFGSLLHSVEPSLLVCYTVCSCLGRIPACIRTPKERSDTRLWAAGNSAEGDKPVRLCPLTQQTRIDLGISAREIAKHTPLRAERKASSDKQVKEPEHRTSS